MSTRYAFLQFSLSQEGPMSQSLCKSQTLIRHSFPISLSHTSSTNINSCVWQRWISLSHILRCIFPHWIILDPLIDSICLVPGNSFSVIGTVCIPGAFPLICVCMPYSPFQNCEAWLMFQVLFSHMHLTVSVESEKFPRLGVVVRNSRKEIWSISHLLKLRGKYSKKNRISRENYSCSKCDWQNYKLPKELTI